MGSNIDELMEYRNKLQAQMQELDGLIDRYSKSDKEKVGTIVSKDQVIDEVYELFKNRKYHNALVVLDSIDEKNNDDEVKFLSFLANREGAPL